MRLTLYNAPRQHITILILIIDEDEDIILDEYVRGNQDECSKCRESEENRNLAFCT